MNDKHVNAIWSYLSSSGTFKSLEMERTYLSWLSDGRKNSAKIKSPLLKLGGLSGELAANAGYGFSAE
ncbi:hypothetical protein A1OO_11110 [Enterovibrio norvegicus FF-33]|uniref:hypothetical protein n=1 Tax=Enterovibrio norvegicus TaxID=188144 RepID=UPI0003683605|nr:hypothetical protein [Enterovibrio norvegicus]OEE66328.1 hypothetical protein A1OO_11110 [Enterovibrio norvegicus FF-33]